MTDDFRKFLLIGVSVVLLASAAYVAMPRPEAEYRPVVSSQPRSPQWPAVRAEHLERHPVCEACGSSERLEVHHIEPFHTNPDRELDPKNLITLCRRHHWEVGHDPDGPGPRRPNWSLSNPNVKRDAERMRHQ